MVTMGFARDEINDALINQKYDEVMATYILLGRKPPEVSFSPFQITVNYFLSLYVSKYILCGIKNNIKILL